MLLSTMLACASPATPAPADSPTVQTETQKTNNVALGKFLLLGGLFLAVTTGAFACALPPVAISLLLAGASGLFLSGGFMIYKNFSDHMQNEAQREPISSNPIITAEYLAQTLPKIDSLRGLTALYLRTPVDLQNRYKTNFTKKTSQISNEEHSTIISSLAKPLFFIINKAKEYFNV